MSLLILRAEAWCSLLTITPEQIAAWYVYRAAQAGETLGFYALATG